jgi:hypothetical protein
MSCRVDIAGGRARGCRRGQRLRCCVSRLLFGVSLRAMAVNVLFGSSIEEFKSLLIDSFQYQQCEESFASWLYAR